jgi:hypothetical protein
MYYFLKNLSSFSFDPWFSLQSIIYLHNSILPTSLSLILFRFFFFSFFSPNSPPPEALQRAGDLLTPNFLLASANLLPICYLSCDKNNWKIGMLE